MALARKRQTTARLRIQTSRGAGMQTMGWSTAGTNKKLKLSRQSFESAWQSAAWRCIRRKKIVYCNDGKRKGTYPNIKFDFL
jgi:hypothetical protein